MGQDGRRACVLRHKKCKMVAVLYKKMYGKIWLVRICSVQRFNTLGAHLEIIKVTINRCTHHITDLQRRPGFPPKQFVFFTLKLPYFPYIYCKIEQTLRRYRSVWGSRPWHSRSAHLDASKTLFSVFKSPIKYVISQFHLPPESSEL